MGLDESVLIRYPENLNDNGYHRALSIDTRIQFNEDDSLRDLFQAIVAADFSAHRSNVYLFLDYKSEIINRMQSIVGHLRTGNLENAYEFLFSDYFIQKCRLIFEKIPPEFRDKVEFNAALGAPFANATLEDVARALYETGILNLKPEKVFKYQEMCEHEFENWLIAAVSPKPRERLVDRQGNPLFGLKWLTNEEVVVRDHDEFMRNIIRGLYVMDSDFYRSRSADTYGFKIGFGITVPVNLRKMVDADLEYMHDLLSLARMNVFEELNLPEETSFQEARTLFYEQVLPPFVSRGIISDESIQNSENTSGYIRIYNYRGTGDSDILSIIFAGLAARKKQDVSLADSIMSAALGLHLADIHDTNSVGNRLLHFGGSDTVLVQRLAQRSPEFKHYLDAYTQPDEADSLIYWSYENPDLEHELASCSESYQVRDITQGDKFHNNWSGKYTSVIERVLDFVKHAGKPIKTGSVPRYVPQSYVGFERTPYKFMLDHVIQTTHKFKEEGLFPKGSWVYDI